MINFAKILHCLPPELAHDTAIKVLRCMPNVLLENINKNIFKNVDLQKFNQTLHGINFTHPVGLAAGFDKNAEVFDKLGQLGFAFAEVGSITPVAQYGNPKPRLFRLNECQAIINSYGFNSKGLQYSYHQLTKHVRVCPIGINLGKNKTSLNQKEVDDFIEGAEKLCKLADYFTVNISSPNTPGLRDLQQINKIEPIIDGVVKVMKKQNHLIPLFVKLSPDMDIISETELVEFLFAKKVDGLIISNTTTSREGIKNPYRDKPGGLSGPPLKERSTAMLRRVYNITRGKSILIASGGICSGQDAYEKLCAGANLLQIYTAFIYQGPVVIGKILLELQEILDMKNIRHISDIIK